MNGEIKQLLKETYPGMTFAEIAEHLGIHRTYLTKPHPIGMRVSSKLAKATGKPIMFFYGK